MKSRSRANLDKRKFIRFWLKRKNLNFSRRQLINNNMSQNLRDIDYGEKLLKNQFVQK